MPLEIKQFNGIVVALKANYFIVEIIINNDDIRLLCTKRNRLSHQGLSVCVGDLVLVESIDLENNTGVIASVSKRNSFLNRPPVANLSDVLVVVSLIDPIVDINQLTRFLITAEFTRQSVSLIITKTDLVSGEMLDDYLRKFKEWGYQTFATSTLNREGINILQKKLKSIKLGVFIGPSGVGKSSLMNLLVPNINIPTGTLSKKLRRGKNTTRHIELFSISPNCWIADTPGFNKADLSISPSDLSQLFPEIRLQCINQKCKFRDCLHINEPGCVVSRDWERYENYKTILEEMIILQNQCLGG